MAVSFALGLAADGAGLGSGAGSIVPIVTQCVTLGSTADGAGLGSIAVSIDPIVIDYGNGIVVNMICVVATDILNGALFFTSSSLNHNSFIFGPSMMTGAIAFLHAAALEAILSMGMIALPVIANVTILIEDTKLMSTIEIVQRVTPNTIIPEINPVCQFPASVVKGIAGFALHAFLPVSSDQFFGVAVIGMLVRTSAARIGMYMPLGTKTMGIHFHFRRQSGHGQHADHHRQSEQHTQ